MASRWQRETISKLINIFLGEIQGPPGFSRGSIDPGFWWFSRKKDPWKEWGGCRQIPLEFWFSSANVQLVVWIGLDLDL